MKNKGKVNLDLQENFPLIEEYRKIFEITDDTIFAYDGVIYTNNLLPDHLITHEKTHLKQQDKIGADKWVQNFLTDPQFRLQQEVEAYRKQLGSIKNREARNKIRIESAYNLSSPLYGNIITYQEALIALK